MGTEERNIKVSVICNAFNHGKYITKALEGFVSQKTNFDFEVIVHDDASIDSTPILIEKYAKKYPSIIHPIFENINKYNSGIDYILDIHLPIVKGKYIAFCEGDDYWTNCNKLQKQYDYMESNAECSLCVHKARKVKEDGMGIGEYTDYSFVTDKETILSPDFVILHMDSFPLNSMFFRTSFIVKNAAILRKMRGFDYVYKALLATEGTVVLLNEDMSAYRVSSFGSWTESVGKNPKKLTDHFNESINSLRLINEYRNFCFDDCINEEISRRKYRMLIINRNYKDALDIKYKTIRKGFGLKHLLKVYIGAYCPRLLQCLGR